MRRRFAQLIFFLAIIIGTVLFWYNEEMVGPFTEGRGLVNEGEYGRAIGVLETYLEEHPRSHRASRALFFIGKAYVGLGQMDRARGTFESVLQEYPRSLEAHKSRYKLAMIALWENRFDDALAGFQILAGDPDGPLAPEAGAMAEWLTRGDQQTPRTRGQILSLLP